MPLGVDAALNVGSGVTFYLMRRPSYIRRVFVSLSMEVALSIGSGTKHRWWHRILYDIMTLIH